MQAGASAGQRPVKLFVIVVAIAVIVSVLIGYLGATGRIGGGIPGEKPPAPSLGDHVVPGNHGPAPLSAGHTVGAPTVAAR